MRRAVEGAQPPHLGGDHREFGPDGRVVVGVHQHASFEAGAEQQDQADRDVGVGAPRGQPLQVDGPLGRGDQVIGGRRAEALRAEAVPAGAVRALALARALARVDR